jgi:ATP-binding cassette subfamily B protein
VSSARAKGAEEHEELDEEFVAGKAWDAPLLRRLLGEARPHRRLFAGTFAVLAALLALELLGPWIIGRAFDGVIAARARGADYAGELWLWAAAYLGCAVLMIAFRYLQTAHLTRAGQAVVADLRAKVFRHLQGLDLGWFDKRSTGSLVTRVTTDVENLNEMFTSGLVELFFDLIQIALLLGVLFLLHWPLALVVLLGLPLFIGVSLVFRGGARNAHRTVRGRLALLNGYLQEVLSGVRVVQVFRREAQVSRRFAGLLDRYLAANITTIFYFALFFPLIDVLVNGVQAATLWVGGTALTPGQFLQFWFYLLMLLEPVRELGERYNVLQSAFASAERIFQVLDERPSVSPPASPRPLPAPGAGAPARGHVRFEHVGFEYLPGVPVLEDVSFEIAPGQTVAVVGATGAGKSTLVNLLLRFYDPTAGRVTLDGVDLRELDPSALRGRVGLVLQEDFLFAGSVRDNVALDRPGVDAARIARALEASRAAELVDRLPGGLDGPVAERGATLSTGERQLLAIARALAGDPELVVLDEATASIDSATEAEIEAATKNLLAGRSALVIAHRLSTVRRADRILVMHRGRLREQGTHKELLARGGIYAKLYAMQFSEDGSGAA